MEFKMEVDGGGGGGGEGSCQASLDSSMTTGLHFIDSGLQVDDVNLVAKQLLHLDDVGNREEFHRQCCEVSCCTAKEVIQIMRNQSYKVSLLQITSESFLLQDLLNPTHYDCTEELLNSWLLVQEDEDQGTTTILENINKMLALVESVEHLVIFLRSILKRFGSRFLGLCTSLALQALKQQRHLTSMDGNQMDDGCKKKLAQTVELISQLFHGNCRRLYLSCLLTLLYVDPSDVRYFALETYFLRSSDGKVIIGSADSSVDQGIYSDLLSTVNLLRPMSLDVELDWPHLKVIAMDLLYRAGYQYEPANNTFRHREPSSAKVCANWNRLGVGIGIGDGSGFATKILATNGEKVTAEGGIWCNSGSGIYLSSDLRTVAWPQGDPAVLSQNFDSFYEVVKADNQTAEKDVRVWNNGTSDACPVSLAAALSDSLPADPIAPANDDTGGSADGGTMPGTDGIGTGPDDRWEVKQLWQTASCQGKASDIPDIVGAENEEGGGVVEENSTSQESSTFPKKRSISAEVVALTETAEPSHKLRTVGSNRFKILRRNRDKDEGETLGTEADTRHKTPEECSHTKRFLRPKDRFLRAQANVTRKTFLFKYTFPKRHQAKEAGKRSASESAVSCDDGISTAKSKYSLPNGVELKSCFIRLNRIESDSGEQEAEVEEGGEDEKPVLEEVKLENGVREEPVALPEELFMQTNSMKEEVTEEKVVQCVCDGCGEVVPDCSWLTAHIVTCTGRPDCGNNDDNAVTDEELAGSFQQDAPIWDPMENRESVSENTIVIVPTTDSNCVNGGLGNILSIESSNDIASFTPQNSSEVDPANLMNLLQNQDNTSSSSSSFIYETASSDNVGGLKVIQISNGDASYSMSNQQQSVTGDVSDEQFGKGIVYNGVYMYEFAEYQCNMCLLAFTSQTAAAEHVQSSDHGQSTISRNSFCCCLKCSIRYREKHIMWLHSQYTCGNVVEELADESRFYRCLLCCKAFLSSAFLRRHVYLQHGRELGLGSFVAAQRQLVETVTDGIGIPQLSAQSCSQLGLNDVPPVVPRLADYRVGMNGSLIGSWYQVNDGTNQMESQMLEDQPVSVFPMQTQDAAEAPDPKNFSQAKATERNATVVQDTVSAATSGESGSADSQALLDLACSIVLGGCSSPPTNFTDSSVPVSTSHSTTVAAAAAATAAPAASVSSSKSAPSNQSRRTAKGIMYKNVFMQCIVNYLCSTCKKDLSTKASKKEHKSASCFDADSKRFTYLRQYSYLCPYCSEKFPSQKFCRQHQLSVCLQLMGVKTDELNHKQLLCPFCDRKYFNIITLKGHMTLIHKVNKIDSSQILGASGLLDELISYAPDGLSEKAKDAKRKVKDENERRTMEENGSLPPKDVVAVAKKPVTSVESTVPADRKSEMNSNAEAVDEEKTANTKEISEDSSSAWANQNPGRNRSGVENGVNVDDSGQECSPNDAIRDIKDEINTANVDIKEELDQNDLHIDADEEEEDEEDDDLIFDADASNDFTSTDELSEFDEEMTCKADDSVVVKAELHESHFGKTDEMAEGKKSLRRRKSKKTRKKVATKSSRRLH